MKHLTFAIVIVLACLATSCSDGCSRQGEETGDTSTFYNTSHSSAEGKDYKSTGDASLLAVKLPTRLDNQTVQYKAITVHYNKHYRLPNCVAYELTNTQAAMADAPDSEKRDNYKFNRDTKVAGCPDWWEYKETGYDRGHMAPAMDMRWDKQAMEQCFLMTNICPQDRDLNDGEWRHMEEAIHTWARKTDRLVIFTGPVLSGDMKKTGKHNDISVPNKFFKVVYSPKQNRAIAFLFDNEYAPKSWTNYAVTVDEVERLTGIDFLAALPDDVETSIESKSDIKSWPRYIPRR